jgi:heptosyltransferase-2
MNRFLDSAGGWLRELAQLPISPWATVALGPLLRRPAPTGGQRRGSPARILVVRLDGLGNLVLTSPLLRELRRENPDAHITLAVAPRNGDYARCCPHVNDVLELDMPAGGPLGAYRRFARALRFARSRLGPEPFDLCLTPRRDVDEQGAAYVAYFSGAARRVGVGAAGGTRRRRRGSRGYGLLFTHRVRSRPNQHEVEHNLEVLAAAGGAWQEDRLELWLDPDRERARAAVVERGVPAGDQPVVVLAPGGNHPRRRWPVDHFAAVGAWLTNAYPLRVVVIGGEQDEPLGQALAKRIGERCLNVAGRLSLPQTAALINRCVLFVGNATGPMHLAAAARVPVVAVSCHPRGGDPESPDSPARCAPWRTLHTVLQPRPAAAACHAGCTADDAHCICGVDPSEACEAAATLLSTAREAGRAGGSSAAGF